MKPFNTNYPTSLFLSQDLIATESVCYDFLATENMKNDGYALINGAQDYMHQAADPANWPATISYDPEGDGTPISSLGVHEHWNNSTDKQYSVNLGIPGGLQLLSVPDSLIKSNPLSISQNKTDNFNITCYPNPATDYINIKYNLNSESTVSCEVYNVSGQQITSIKNTSEPAGEHFIRLDFNNSHYALPNGTYCCVLKIGNNKNQSLKSITFQIMK